MYLMHLLCLAPLWRYYHTLQALIYKRPTPTGTYNESLRDVSMLRLIEVGFWNFLRAVGQRTFPKYYFWILNQGVCESTPQLILQLYIIMSGTHETDFMAIVSSTFSVISVGWGLAAYTRALRKAYSVESKHREMTRPAVLVNFLWVRHLKFSPISLKIPKFYLHFWPPTHKVIFRDHLNSLQGWSFSFYFLMHLNYTFLFQFLVVGFLWQPGYWPLKQIIIKMRGLRRHFKW